VSHASPLSAGAPIPHPPPAPGASHQVDALLARNAALEAQLHAQSVELRGLATDLATAEHEERRRISHVLHDDLQQQLYAVGMALDLLKDPDFRDDPVSLLAQARTMLNAALELTRTLSTELSPAVLDEETLRPILDWIVERKHQMYGLRVTVVGAAHSGISPYALRVVLAQAIRETLFNVVKHAQVLDARLRVEEVGSLLRVTIEDDGVGFEPSERLGGGRKAVGLGGLQDRLSLMGGSMRIASARGGGTRITLEVPAQPAVSSHAAS
jgi:signal transduction histidine kinase